MRTEIEIYSQITVHAVSMFVIRALHHVALHSVYAYSRTESIAPMARGSPDAGTHNLGSIFFFNHPFMIGNHAGQ